MEIKYLFGYYKNIGRKQLETSAEIYYKITQNALDFKGGAKLLLNHQIETDIVNARGKAYGIEFMLKKPLGKLNGWVTYTYSRTFLQTRNTFASEIINRGKHYPSNYDKPHSANFVGNYKFSRRFNFSLNMNYSTGRPLTIPLAQYELSGSNRFTIQIETNIESPIISVPTSRSTLKVTIRLKSWHTVPGHWPYIILPDVTTPTRCSLYRKMEKLKDINYPFSLNLFRPLHTISDFKIMQNRIILKLKNIWMLVIITSCIEPYTPPEIEDNPNILVVDGFLDATKRECIVTLSKTKKLGSVEPINVEIGAIVSLEEKGGSTVILTDNQNGIYSLSNIPVTVKKEYRIKVKTSNQTAYSSDFVELKASPDIDSITWDATQDGISIYTTTHDPTNNSRYYKWNFIETWQYSSPFFSSVIFQNGAVVRREDDIYNCWQEQKSTSILIGSSTNLVEDVIYKNPINFIPKNSNKYYLRYSILVQQQVLSKEAFNYWNELLKNTENLGTLFDPQPSQVLGNIHNDQNLTDPVLGYFSASFTSEKRIFIRYSEVAYLFPFTIRDEDCIEDTVLLADVPKFGTTGQLLTNPVGISLIGYGYSSVSCVDCRSKGGTNTKPSFW